MEAMSQSFIKEPIFRQLGKKARYAALTDREKKAYNESLKAYRDAHAIAETERAEGRAEGIEIERRNSIMLMHAMGIATEKIAEEFRMPLKDVIDILEKK